MRARTHLERKVPPLSIRELELDSDTKVGGMAAGSPTHLVYAASVTQCVVERCTQSVGDEPQRIQEVALP
jgi:hypothetical protein